MKTQVRSLVSLSGLRSRHCRELLGRSQRQLGDLVLPWLRCRLATAIPIPPLAWEPPCTAGAALKRQRGTRRSERRWIFCLCPSTMEQRLHKSQVIALNPGGCKSRGRRTLCRAFSPTNPIRHSVFRALWFRPTLRRHGIAGLPRNVLGLTSHQGTLSWTRCELTTSGGDSRGERGKRGCRDFSQQTLTLTSLGKQLRVDVVLTVIRFKISLNTPSSREA